jgi:hypothetical protein
MKAHVIDDDMTLIALGAVAACTIKFAKTVSKEVGDLDSSCSVVLDFMELVS